MKSCHYSRLGWGALPSRVQCYNFLTRFETALCGPLEACYIRPLSLINNPSGLLTWGLQNLMGQQRIPSSEVLPLFGCILGTPDSDAKTAAVKDMQVLAGCSRWSFDVLVDQPPFLWLGKVLACWSHSSRIMLHQTSGQHHFANQINDGIPSLLEKIGVPLHQRKVRYQKSCLWWPWWPSYSRNPSGLLTWG